MPRWQRRHPLNHPRRPPCQLNANPACPVGKASTLLGGNTRQDVADHLATSPASPGHLAGLKHLSPTPLCPLPHVSTLPLCPSSLARTHPWALTFPGKSDETEAPRLAAGVLAHGAIHNGSVLAERLTQFRCLRTEAVGRGWERGRRGSEFVSTAVCPHIPEDSTRFEARLLKMAAHYPKK